MPSRLNGIGFQSKIKKYYEKSSLLHNSFEAVVLIKGIDGVLEIIGAFLLIFVNRARLDRIVEFLTQHELSEDKNDIIANLILRASHDFSVSSQYFGFIYLLSHGVVKVFLVAMLLRKKLWSYPLTEAFLILFIVYQVYRYTYSHSVWMIALTIFDIVIIFLTWLEYTRIKDILAER